PRLRRPRRAVGTIEGHRRRRRCPSIRFSCPLPRSTVASDVVSPPSPTDLTPAENPTAATATTETTTGAQRLGAPPDLFGERRDVVVVRVDGELWDLDREIPAGHKVEPVTISEPDGLAVLRHSAAHVLAQAVQQVNPDAKLGIGPPVTDGFYYDFDVEKPFTPEDLKALDKAMSRIIREGQTFRRRVVTEEEARAELADEPYKLELIGLK